MSVSWGTIWSTLTNTTNRPSPLIDGSQPPMSASAPVDVRLTRLVVFATRSRTNTSVHSLVSPVTSPGESDSYAMKRPSLLSEGRPLSSVAWIPFGLVETRVVVPVVRSRRKTWEKLLFPPVTRPVLSETNATNRPSPLIAGESRGVVAGPVELQGRGRGRAGARVTHEDRRRPRQFGARSDAHESNAM